MSGRSRYLNTSLAKALRVCELFDGERAELSLSEIASALGSRPGSVYPIVYTLQSFGYLERDPDTKRFRLGLKFLALANHILSSLDIREKAKPVLKELARRRPTTPEELAAIPGLGDWSRGQYEKELLALLRRSR